jgi:hypothetical protein
MSEHGAPDVEAVVGEIRAEVARRRAAGEYPAGLVAALGAQLDTDPADTPLEDLADIQTVRALGSSRSGSAARLAVSAKRAVRRGVAWYVQPIVEDQVRLNFTLVRRLYEMEARVTELEQRVRELGGDPAGR